MNNRSPFQIVILVACVLTGLVGLITGSSSPASIAEVYGDWAVLWNVGVVLGGVGTLGAMFSPVPANLLVERVGMIWLATMFFAYAVAIALYNDPDRVVAGLGTDLALATACLVRAYQISRQLALLRAALRRSE
jgi:hypothetical protein